MRKEFRLTPEQKAKILEASKPVPAMFLSGGIPMAGTPQENANRAWRFLGEELGFDYMSVMPSNRGDDYFTAVTKEQF